MIGKYAVSVEHVLFVLDSPVACPRCGRLTAALFDAQKVCSRCAGVLTLAERAMTEAAIRRPFPVDPKPRWAPPRKEDKAAEVKMLIQGENPEYPLATEPGTAQTTKSSTKH